MQAIRVVALVRNDQRVKKSKREKLTEQDKKKRAKLAEQDKAKRAKLAEKEKAKRLRAKAAEKAKRQHIKETTKAMRKVKPIAIGIPYNTEKVVKKAWPFAAIGSALLLVLLFWKKSKKQEPVVQPRPCNLGARGYGPFYGFF